MIQQIINDAKAMEAEAIKSEEDAQKAYEDFVKETNSSIEAKSLDIANKSEEDAQKAYEDFVKETNASIESKSKDIANKSEEKAKAEGDLVQANEEKESTLLELEQLSNYNAELHESCDFIVKNFEIR